MLATEANVDLIQVLMDQTSHRFKMLANTHRSLQSLRCIRSYSNLHISNPAIAVLEICDRTEAQLDMRCNQFQARSYTWNFAPRTGMLTCASPCSDRWLRGHITTSSIKPANLSSQFLKPLVPAVFHQ